MTNFLCRWGFHRFSALFDLVEVTYIVCMRCGDSKHLHTFPSDDDGDPLALPESAGNVIAFARRSAMTQSRNDAFTKGKSA